MRTSTLSLLILCAAVLLFAASAAAQDDGRRVHIGPCATASIKYQFFPSGRNYMLFGQGGMGAAIRIAGAQPEALSFLSKVALCRENTGYRQTSGVRYYIENLSLVLNPEVLIPTRKERWQFTAGLGIDWTLNTSLALYTNNAYHGGGDIDEAHSTIVAAQRKVVPFVSGGVLCHVKGPVYVQAFLRQQLLNSYYAGTTVIFGKGRDDFEVELVHQPTSLGLSLICLL